MPNENRFPFYGWVALCALVVAQGLLFAGVEVVRYWFFPLAWWPYILIVDGLVYHRKGSSLLKTEILKGNIGAGCCEVDPGAAK